MIKPDRKATDEEIHILVNEGGVPVRVLADLLKTSRGHIMRCLYRYADPVAYRAKEKMYVRPQKRVR
jgi:hypothetical protein